MSISTTMKASRPAAPQNHIQEGLASRIFDVANVIFLCVVGIITLYPMLYVLFASFSDSSLLVAHQGILLHPLGFTTAAYQLVFRDPMITRGFVNSLLILAVGVPLNILFTALGAYFLSRENVMFRVPITFFIVFTMYFSGGMIPFYLVVKGVGLQDNFLAVVIPFLISTFNLIIMRTSFAAIPKELEESAKLDGAGHLRIMTRIVLPLSKAVIAVMVLYYGVDKWNGWFWASVFLTKRHWWPIQLVLRSILLANDTTGMTAGVGDASEAAMIAEAVKYGTIIVATVPILLIYPFIQKYFVKGVMIGAVKG